MVPMSIQKHYQQWGGGEVDRKTVGVGRTYTMSLYDFRKRTTQIGECFLVMGASKYNISTRSNAALLAYLTHFLFSWLVKSG